MLGAMHSPRATPTYTGAGCRAYQKRLFAAFAATLLAIGATMYLQKHMLGGERRHVPPPPSSGGERSQNDATLRDALHALRSRVGAMETELNQLRRRARVAPPATGGGTVVDDVPGWLNNERTSNVRVPDGWASSLTRRLRYLEIRFASLLGWVNDPRSPTAVHYRCKNRTDLHPDGDAMSRCCGEPDCRNEDGTCNEGHRNYDHVICFDNWLPAKPTGEREKCVVYDFGLRAEPHFGVHMAERGCEVHGFDPSPVTRRGFDDANNEYMQRAKRHPHYHFHPYGSGGVDGNVTLYEYNWGQVSILNWRDFGGDQSHGPKRTFGLAVKTLPTIMQALGHDRISVLKIDVEGSEWNFLENMFDKMGCPPVDQITIEYHHFTRDDKYGTTPEIAVVSNLLRVCGFKVFDRLHTFTVHDKKFKRDMTYGMAGYCRRCGEAKGYEGPATAWRRQGNRLLEGGVGGT